MLSKELKRRLVHYVFAEYSGTPEEDEELIQMSDLLRLTVEQNRIKRQLQEQFPEPTS
jgi:hypothetical protein